MYLYAIKYANICQNMQQNMQICVKIWTEFAMQIIAEMCFKIAFISSKHANI